MNTNLSGVRTCFFQVKSASIYLALNSQPSPLYSFSVSYHLFPILASFDSYLKTQLILPSESLQFHIIVLREAKFLDPEKADKVSS